MIFCLGWMSSIPELTLLPTSQILAALGLYCPSPSERCISLLVRKRVILWCLQKGSGCCGQSVTCVPGWPVNYLGGCGSGSRSHYSFLEQPGRAKYVHHEAIKILLFAMDHVIAQILYPKFLYADWPAFSSIVCKWLSFDYCPLGSCLVTIQRSWCSYLWPYGTWF